jgi:hypothetical protein
MDRMIDVETQGISDDWISATGDFNVKSRGLLKRDQILSAMLHLSQLDTPDGDDPCPPQIMTHGPAGSLSFIGQGGTIYCPESDCELNARQACDAALGKKAVAPPPPMPTPVRPASSAVAPPVISPPKQTRKFGLRGGIVLFLSLCFLLGAIVMVFGVFSMKDRGMPRDDILAAMTIAGGLALGAVLLFALAFKARRIQYHDKKGRRVSDDGSALAFVAMGQSLGDFDAGDDGFDGDFD